MLKGLSFILVGLLLQLDSTNGQTLQNLPDMQVIEGVPFSVCFTITATPVGSDFIVNVGSDTEFENLDETLIFADGTTVLTQCISELVIAVDNVVEPIDVLLQVFTVTTTFQGQVSMMKMGQLLVTDNTVLAVGFVVPSYTFIEGTELQNLVCVSVDGTIEVSSIVLSAEISYIPGSAVPLDDYTVGLTTVGFSSVTVGPVCVILNINDDDEFEGAETLTVQLMSDAPNLLIDPDKNTATITILDLDANCGPPPTGDGTVGVAPSNPPYGMDDSGTLVANPGAVVTYTCLNQDILLMGIPQLTCTSVGDTSAEWSPVNPPTCDLGTVMCSPLSIENGQVLGDDRTVNAEVTYTCDENFALLGDSSRVCQPNGQWTGSDPTCVALLCPFLDNPLNGEVLIEGGRTVGSTATYSCAEGFILTGGSEMRTCEEDLTWSGPEPTCESEDEATGSSSSAATGTMSSSTNIITTSGAPPANSNLIMYCIVHALLYIPMLHITLYSST